MLPGDKIAMEHTGLEPVTPTLPVLCALDCVIRQSSIPHFMRERQNSYLSATSRSTAMPTLMEKSAVGNTTKAALIFMNG